MNPASDPYVELLDHAVITVGAEDRAARTWHRRVADESATWAASLHGLSERRMAVGIQVVGGEVHHGVITRLGVDVVVLGRPDGDLLVRFAAVTGVVVPGDTPDVGRGTHGVDRTLMEELEATVGVGRRVVVTVDAGRWHTGDLVALGEDVVALRSSGQTTLLPAAAIMVVRCLE